MPSEDLTMFDPVYNDQWPNRIQGYVAKEEGIAKALQPDAIQQWKQDFTNCVTAMADAGLRFTSEDVIEKIGLPHEAKTNANNSVGAMMNALAKKGVIRKTTERRLSQRPTSHARELAVWAGPSSIGET